MITIFVMGTVLVMLGGALAFVGFGAGRRNKGFNARAVSVQGIVVGNREHYSTSSSIHRRVYFPRVRYAASAGQQLEADAPGQDAPLAEGTPFPLLYDPQNPTEVSFTGPGGTAGVASALGILGIVLVVLGVATIGGTAVLFAL